MLKNHPKLLASVHGVLFPADNAVMCDIVASIHTLRVTLFR